MPPITVLAIEPDDAGGWLLHWRDEANLDGDPLEAFSHVTCKLADELEEARRRSGMGSGKMADASWQLYADELTCAHLTDGTQRDRLGIPDDVDVPYAVRDFIEGYDQHVGDLIARAGPRTRRPSAVDDFAVSRSQRPEGRRDRQPVEGPG